MERVFSSKPSERSFHKARALLRPHMIAAVVTKAGKKVNLAPITWHVVSSRYERSWVACIGITNTGYSLAAIKRTKEFVLAFPSHTQIKDVLWCGTVSGKSVDKAAATDLEFSASQRVSAPCLKNAVLNLECRVLKDIKMKTFTIVIGAIVWVHASARRAQKVTYALGDEQYGVVTGTKILQKGRK